MNILEQIYRMKKKIILMQEFQLDLKQWFIKFRFNKQKEFLRTKKINFFI